MRKWVYLFCLVGWMNVPLRGAVAYSTFRLQAIASRLDLPGIDTLSAGEYICFSYKSHPLTIRVNEWKEVEHIGLALFRPEAKEGRSSFLYDFLERYFLELDMVQGTEYAVRLGFENVYMDVGTPAVAFGLDGTEEFRQTYVTFKTYHVEWLKGNKVILSLRFDMNCQLLFGCDVAELERNYLKKVKRYKAVRPIASVYDSIFPDDASYYVGEGSAFIIDAIRNDLYFHKCKEGWKLVSDSAKPRLSIANVMLSGETEGDYDLSVTFDMYGYKEEKFTVKLADWQGLCTEEGCVPYWGMKNKVGSVYEGTVFMVNDRCGFVHMLSVEFPVELLNSRRGMIKGRLYAYIPLHYITEKFFHNADYNKVSDENKSL